jgi:hypothetical protein
MSEPREPRKMIEPANWNKFLQEFSERNANRRARFNIFFSSGETVEEAEEGHLKNVSLKKEGGKTQIIIERVDRSGDDEQAMSDTIENVRGVGVQYETDGSENILEITDEKNTLISLRLESKLDGNS